MNSQERPSDLVKVISSHKPPRARVMLHGRDRAAASSSPPPRNGAATAARS